MRSDAVLALWIHSCVRLGVSGNDDNNRILDGTHGVSFVGLDAQDDYKYRLEARTERGPDPGKSSLRISLTLFDDTSQRLRERLASINSAVQNLPLLIRPWINLACVSVMQPYADASEGKRLCWKICLLNLGVWGAWKVGRWRPFMKTWFMHNPLSGRSLTLLASIFRYDGSTVLQNEPHRPSAIARRCTFYSTVLPWRALVRLFPLLTPTLIVFQVQPPITILSKNKARRSLKYSSQHRPTTSSLSSCQVRAHSRKAILFLNPLAAGVFSGLVSHVVSAKFRYPRLVAQLASPANAPLRTETWSAALAASGTAASTTAAAASTVSSQVTKKSVLEILPSLGASGAIYATVTMTALAFPDSQVALFIPPSYPINIQTGVGGLLLLDMIGIARGWR